MKERVKSWVLLLLVIGSLVESYYLIYRLPGADSAVFSATTYIKTDNMGPELKVEDLLYPDQMIIHRGEDRHTLFYPGTTFYNLILGRLKGRSFESFERRSVSEFDWTRIRKEDPGIELTFGSGIPVQLLQRTMQMAPDSLFDDEIISRIWIYSVPNDSKAHAVFFSERGDIVYEAAKVDLTVQDIQQHVDFGSGWTPYTTADGSYYVPENDLPMVAAELPSGLYTIAQMQSSLFFDAGSTRYIQEKDGSEIYTDSKRSLQVDPKQNWISYSDPAALPAGEGSPAEDVLEAVDFVNKHGGWNGTYRLDRAEEGPEERRIVFQQYYGLLPYGSFPVLNESGLRYGSMELLLQQGSVAGYERSLMYADEDLAEKKAVKLRGGDVLRSRLAALAGSAGIRALQPGYLPSVQNDRIILTPVWKVTLKDGRVLALDL
ncbi:hypothetical protein F4V43_08820 [Paenibacillus spiritus]|uniref:Regulatory protein YycH domain-containing protein n=1 Tax=Paenibacillus spiritus TaxID=2496557 RepID=A0A5J5GB47_9BACL|nr:two-component system activity regulator YycH [Paenibacillus spiritus]KAA9005160.1 hypothetical protein F4V43_08820 [Paenibacillus spiritus]